MRDKLTAALRAVSGLGSHRSPPTEAQLERAFGRASAAGICYALAALVLHETGYAAGKGTYLAMALAMLPQIALFLRVRSKPEERRTLHMTRWPMPLHAVIAIVLAIMAVVVLARNGITFAPGWAAAIAAVAASLAACPPVVWFPARPVSHPH